jgi:predicted NACHT family NTPase
MLWAIIGPLLAWVLKDIIKKHLEEIFKPFCNRFITTCLVSVGAYHAARNRYLATLRNRLKKGGYTQQLLGEGVDLDHNYIQIQLSKEEYKHPETIPAISSAQQQTPSVLPKIERLEVSEVLANEEQYGNCIVIIGDPGAGKTTLMQYLAYQCAKHQGAKSIPALITLSVYVKHGARSLTAYLAVLFEENAFQKAENYIEGQLKEGNFLLLLDGFDEIDIERRSSLRREIEALASNVEYANNKIIVTSRPIRDAVFDEFRHLEVMPLTSEQRQRFLENKVDNRVDSSFTADRCAQLSRAIEEHDRLRKLAENPLLLTFLYHVYKYNLDLPRRRVELYRLAIDLMLDWDIKTGRPTHIKVKDRDGYLFKVGQLEYDCRYSKMHGMPVTGGRSFRSLKPLWYKGVPP